MTGNTERKNRASTEHLFVQWHFNQIGPEISWSRKNRPFYIIGSLEIKGE